MHAVYIAKRFGVFLVIVWLAATLNFFLPKLSGQDPVRTKLMEEAALGGYVHAGIEDMVKEYQKKFGLDQPLWRQYLNYLADVSRGDLNYSIANYPRTVAGMIGEAGRGRLACLASPRCFHSWPALSWVLCWRGPGAVVDALGHAAIMGIARHPVFPARPGAHVSVRISIPVAADLWRLQCGCDTGPELGVHPGRAAPRGAAGAFDRAGVGWRLGAGHARHDGDDDGRGLRHVRRGEGAAQRHHLHPLLHPQRDSAADDGAGAGAWDRSCRARCWWR